MRSNGSGGDAGSTHVLSPPHVASPPGSDQAPLAPLTSHDRHIVRLCLLPFAALTLTTVLGGVLLLRSKSGLAAAAFVSAAVFLVCSFAVPAIVVTELRARKRDEERCVRDCDRLTVALKTIGNDTLRELAVANFTQMRQFVTIAQKQARMSYNASLVAAGVGLGVLVMGAAASAGLGMTSAKITAGVLTAAGAVLSGFLTRTFVRTYTLSSRQLSYYYGQPLVHCYLLHAEWLASEAFGNGQVEPATLSALIDASLKASHAAQDHLLTMEDGDRLEPSPTSAERD